MTKLLLILTLILSSHIVLAKCIDENYYTGSQIEDLTDKENLFIMTKNNTFKKISKIKISKNKKYLVQRLKHKNSKSLSAYNDKYIKYYDYSRLNEYLESIKSKLKERNLQLSVVGKSIRGRNLYSITPKVLENKKTILMLGRQHGDEGTANWIIEGFLDDYLDDPTFFKNYQLVLYPMINPDGVESMSRYNANGRDLNRSWGANSSEDLDEIKYIHSDLKNKLSTINKRVLISLDMHGSFTKDFFFIVKKNYISRRFYKRQKDFVDELSKFDPWQGGKIKTSNGDSGMARIVFIRKYKYNALTHETIKNIPLKKDNRSIKTLYQQGEALKVAIKNLY